MMNLVAFITGITGSMLRMSTIYQVLYCNPWYSPVIPTRQCPAIPRNAQESPRIPEEFFRNPQ